MFEMKPEYMTGITMIDEEHQKLFELADQLYDLLNNDFIHDKFDYIVEVINGLKEYAKKHFKDEEEYMMSINYKRLFSHKIEHQAFLEKMEGLDLESIDEDQKQTCLELLGFVSDWLVNHILGNDILIGK
ncbi:bacteriohemerythrin [Lachnoclostridium phytofermentans]|uniref:Hemerythrin-like metal-binding protein n=1 Tax=Lachnoclostridium phytofermentans (strain ATCC 700394 / DSM 18823 / ISDg) TaxID=357809 RepID=A9KT53_LACP7|nr:hemerythrin family protein [Lachnoclostridium phytofermentans]ABX42264.1 hemerythrin-like metal-binding protein [Lachnoclostridium phytofermentans ISDg]